MRIGRYAARFAESESDRVAACRLRFRVFNLELGEGLEASYATGLDEDRFDAICEHLIVEDTTSGEVVGTYRMQSGTAAAAQLGYYSAQEFCFDCYEGLRSQILELGRASIACEHRCSEVLTLLWRGIAIYARSQGLRYLVGCSSLTTQDPAEGWAVYDQLSGFLAEPELRTEPVPCFALPPRDPSAEVAARVPRLLRTYIGVGARIGGPPAWDVEFGTIDFLTFLDLDMLTPAARNRFLPSE